MKMIKQSAMIFAVFIVLFCIHPMQVKAGTIQTVAASGGGVDDDIGGKSSGNKVSFNTADTEEEEVIGSISEKPTDLPIQKSIEGWQIAVIVFLIIMLLLIIYGVVYYRQRYGKGFWDYYMPKD